MNLVQAQAGKVTVGLASHWSGVTDNSGITTYGLTALSIGREMSTPRALQYFNLWTMGRGDYYYFLWPTSTKSI